MDHVLRYELPDEIPDDLEDDDRGKRQGHGRCKGLWSVFRRLSQRATAEKEV